MNNRKMIYLDDAIIALERKKDKKAKGDIGGFYNKIIQNDIDALMQLPPAQSEPKKGRWIFIGDGYKCSECRSVYSWWADSQTSNYCPNCGADMRHER